MKVRPTATHRLVRGLLPVLALAAGGCPVTQSQDTPAKQFVCREPTSNTKYHLYVPSTYDQNDDRRWPVALTLHGTYGFDDARRQIQEWKALAEQHQFIVAAPELKSTQGVAPVFPALRERDLETDEQRILGVLADLKHNYRIDETAVMLTGYSAGGYPLWHTALRNPERFSVVVSRLANCDMRMVRDIPITDRTRQIHFLIFFSKRGINRISSNLNPVARESYAIFGHLRVQKCYGATLHKEEGGHRRMPEPAYEFWAKVQPHIRVPEEPEE